jgi:hypothetical protein
LDFFVCGRETQHHFEQIKNMIACVWKEMIDAALCANVKLLFDL